MRSPSVSGCITSQASSGAGEMARTGRAGGAVCEFSAHQCVRHRLQRPAQCGRCRVARAVSRGEAYEYLAESVRAWPDQASWRTRFRGPEWSGCGGATGGIVALHAGYKPGPPGDRWEDSGCQPVAGRPHARGGSDRSRPRNATLGPWVVPRGRLRCRKVADLYRRQHLCSAVRS